VAYGNAVFVPFLKKRNKKCFEKHGKKAPFFDFLSPFFDFDPAWVGCE
jgi:hypothetical protein